MWRQEANLGTSATGVVPKMKLDIREEWRWTILDLSIDNSYTISVWDRLTWHLPFGNLCRRHKVFSRWMLHRLQFISSRPIELPPSSAARLRVWDVNDISTVATTSFGDSRRRKGIIELRPHQRRLPPQERTKRQRSVINTAQKEGQIQPRKRQRLNDQPGIDINGDITRDPVYTIHYGLQHACTSRWISVIHDLLYYLDRQVDNWLQAAYICEDGKLETAVLALRAVEGAYEGKNLSDTLCDGRHQVDGRRSMEWWMLLYWLWRLLKRKKLLAMGS